jgi:hypothetical protein
MSYGDPYVAASLIEQQQQLVRAAERERLA